MQNVVMVHINITSTFSPSCIICESWQESTSNESDAYDFNWLLLVLVIISVLLASIRVRQVTLSPKR
ncbi:unnamed protein product [Adineta ricciae]|uniref:Uncharacterized protein n=1 Tax=Adineta ricciae TaxID=249248 RepID=A0A814E3P6_ADIRI|nr:unnamed protein product [Adineta ricciae]